MAKKLRRLPSLYERGQAGCMQGFINIFDFRHGRSTRRLLSDRRPATKQLAGTRLSTAETIPPSLAEICESLVDTKHHKMPVVDVSQTSVKELMEEEMFNEQGLRNQSNGPEMALGKIGPKYQDTMEKNCEGKDETFRKYRDMDVTELDAAKCLPENVNEVPEVKPLDCLDLEILMQELARIYQCSTECMKHDFHGDLETHSAQATTVVEEKLVTAVDLFIKQRLSNRHIGEEGKPCCSKEFIDALQKISSNKSLFLKILRDRSSVMIKDTGNLEDAQVGEDRHKTCSSFPSNILAEEKPKELKSNKFNSRRHLKFFHRRSKSLGSHPLGGDKDCLSSSNIVVLKAGLAEDQSHGTGADVCSISLQSHYKRDNKAQNERNLFSFAEITRKLRQAMGKQRRGFSQDGNGNRSNKGTTGENFGWSSPHRSHFYTERLAKSSSSFRNISESKDCDSGMVTETCQHAKLGVSSIHIEAKRHIFEMLNNGDETADSVTKKLSKSLGSILSLPDYGSSQSCSPGKNSDDILAGSPMSLSPKGSVTNGFLQDNSNYLSPSTQTRECQPRISGSHSDNKVQCLNMDVNIPVKDDKEYSSEIQPFTENSMVPEVSNSSSDVVEIQEKTEIMPEEEEKTTSGRSESSSKLTTGDTENGDISVVDSGESTFQCLEDSSSFFKPDSFGEAQILTSLPLSPTCSPISREIKDSKCAINRTEQPSPVSVLEPLFIDHDISPSSSTSQPVEKEPQHIHFEGISSASDHGTCVAISLEDEESAFEYIEAVLLGSGLNWDEFLLRWISMCDILDQFLFDEVEVFSCQPRHDQKLLFDCANEALDEACESYLGSFTGTLHGKQNVQPVPKGSDLIHEVWKRVELHLFQSPMLHSLDQLVERDMAGSRKWMNLQSDVELVCSEMGETLLDDLVQETLLTYAHNTSEYNFAVLQGESDAIDDTNL